MDDTVLVYAVEPLLTPEGHGLADVAVSQLEAYGATVERVEQPHESVLSVGSSVEERWLEARILASRGWVFLISAPSARECGSVAELLDRAIAEIEPLQPDDASTRSAKSPTIAAASRSWRQR